MSDQPKIKGYAPCPCGSGIKYRRCCANPKVRELRLQVIQLGQIAHILVGEICQRTGSNAVVIPFKTLTGLRPGIRPIMAPDPSRAHLVLSCEKPAIIYQGKNIVLPN